MINNSDIYDNLNIYKHIIKEYNLELFNESVIHKIYLIKIEINKFNSDINKNLNKINKFKLDLIENISAWKLEDSCNKNKLKDMVENIKKTHEIITYLNYLNNDLKNIINSYEIRIKTLIKNNIIKTEDTNIIKTEDTNIIKTEDTNIIKTEDSNIIKTEESNIIKTEESNIIKTEESNIIKTEESNIIKTEESNIIKTEESNIIKTEESNIIKKKKRNIKKIL